MQNEEDQENSTENQDQENSSENEIFSDTSDDENEEIEQINIISGNLTPTYERYGVNCYICSIICNGFCEKRIEESEYPIINGLKSRFTE